MVSELDIKLLPWQQEVWNDPVRFKIVAAGRRTGKSRLAAWLLIVNALKKDRSIVFYVAPTQGQARDIMWDTLMDLGHPVIASSHINNLQIKLINGSTISLKGGDRPETMRGISLKFLVLDEYADIKSEVWEQILRPALADQKGQALFIGTPMGRNHFYELYKYGEFEEDPSYKSWHFTSYDNPLLDKDEINAAQKSMSSYAFRQEFMASFEARGSEVFKEDWIKFSEEKPENYDCYVAVDVSGFQDLVKKKTKNTRLDNTSICVVFVNEDGWYVENIVYGRWTVEETAQKIFQVVRDYKPLCVGIERCISYQAVMPPLLDMMRRNNFFFHIEEILHNNVKKIDRVIWALQGRFENGIITLNKGAWNSRFLDELFQFPDILTHDDLVDSLAYIDQLAKVTYGGNYEELSDFEIIDSVAGY
tara:strand:+ start:1130 stop:2389 length:1260 start_codon:yes stop_codon:yes gene_type:complete